MPDHSTKTTSDKNHRQIDTAKYEKAPILWLELREEGTNGGERGGGNVITGCVLPPNKYTAYLEIEWNRWEKCSAPS